MTISTTSKIKYRDIKDVSYVSNFKGSLLDFLDTIDPNITVFAYKATARYLSRKYPERDVILANEKTAESLTVFTNAQKMACIFITNEFTKVRDAELFLALSTCKLVMITNTLKIKEGEKNVSTTV